MPEERKKIALPHVFKNNFAVVVRAPITAEYAAAIGADAFGKNALDAVAKCLALRDQPTR